MGFDWNEAWWVNYPGINMRKGKWCQIEISTTMHVDTHSRCILKHVPIVCHVLLWLSECHSGSVWCNWTVADGVGGDMYFHTI